MGMFHIVSKTAIILSIDRKFQIARYSLVMLCLMLLSNAWNLLADYKISTILLGRVSLAILIICTCSPSGKHPVARNYYWQVGFEYIRNRVYIVFPAAGEWLLLLLYAATLAVAYQRTSISCWSSSYLCGTRWYIDAT